MTSKHIKISLTSNFKSKCTISWTMLYWSLNDTIMQDRHFSGPEWYGIPYRFTFGPVRWYGIPYRTKLVRKVGTDFRTGPHRSVKSVQNGNPYWLYGPILVRLGPDFLENLETNNFWKIFGKKNCVDGVNRRLWQIYQNDCPIILHHEILKI